MTGAGGPVGSRYALARQGVSDGILSRVTRLSIWSITSLRYSYKAVETSSKPSSARAFSIYGGV